MGVMPMSGLFILFDFVMNNPLDEETRDNMTLLDVVTGYFSHLEYISKGALPGSIFSEFTQIAREFCAVAESRAKQSSHNCIEPAPTMASAQASNEDCTHQNEQQEGAVSRNHGLLLSCDCEERQINFRAANLFPVGHAFNAAE